MKRREQGFRTTNIISAAIVLTVVVAGFFLVQKFKNRDSKNTDTVAGKSIAVLPFVNLGNEPDQEYFSDGLAEGILYSLAQVKGLKVCASSSSFQLQGKGIDIKQAGIRLGVQTVLEGSFQLAGNRVRITVQLINAKDGFHFWSEQYDENIDDVFALQDKIAQAVARKLEISFSENEDPVAAKKSSISKIPYQLYLQGRSYWNLGTPQNLTKAIDFFERAIQLDTLFAQAYSGVADCYTALGYGSFLAPKDAFPKALTAATKALALQPTLAEPHASLGFYKFYFEWDWAAAEQEFRIAISLNPNYEIAYDYYGYYLTAMKRYDEAKVILQKAAALDPLSVHISTDMGFSFYYSGDYDLATKKLQSTLLMDPKYMLAHLWLGRTYQAKKIYPEAINEYKTALAAAVNWPVALAAIGNVYGISGDKQAAQRVLDTLSALSARKYVTSYGVALVYAGLDQKDQAFSSLNKAFEERSNWLVWLKTDPRLASLRLDKRYAQLVNNIGLPN
jgi:adenylate cyclase